MKERRSAALGFIFVTILIDVIGVGIIIPVLPDLIQELTGSTIAGSSRYGGLLLASYALMQFLFSPVIGGLSDQFGRRPILLGSLLGLGIDYVFMALSPSIAWLFLGRIIAGVMGASFSTAYAYIADISTPEKRAQNFGIVGAAFGLGFIIGPAVGGLLGSLGSRIPFYAAASLSLINFLYGFLILPESLKKENRRTFDISRANPIGSITQLKKYPHLIGLVLALFLIYIANHSVQGTWAYYTEEKLGWDSKMVGISLGFVGLISAIVQGGLIRLIIPRLGPTKSLFIGLVLYTTGNVLFAFADNTWMMFAFIVPYCFGYIAMPSIQGILSNNIPPNAQGELQGTLASLMSVASVVGPLIMNELFYIFSNKNAIIYFPGAHLILGALLAICSIFIAWYSLPLKTSSAS